MTCPACVTSSVRLHHEFRAGCPGCKARAAARSPAYAESAKQGAPTASYRDMCRALGVKHAAVVAAHGLDFLSRMGEKA